jgi:hypothetical protein
MRFSINLRGDLAKLSDADLAERLEATWQAYESVKRLGGLGFGGLPSGQRPAALSVGGRGLGSRERRTGFVLGRASIA